jgi:hypothetical protein
MHKMARSFQMIDDDACLGSKNEEGVVNARARRATHLIVRDLVQHQRTICHHNSS